MNFTKRLSIFLLLLLSVVAVYAGGISNAKELVAFAKALNKGEDISAWRNEKGVICLEGDIDMAKVKKWTPIKEFKGSFDGNGFALLNWKSKSGGLFDLVAEGSVVKNVRIDGSSSMTIAKGEPISGFIARVNKGTIQNCENNAPISYKATYTETKNSYTITWKNDDGSVIDTTTVEYGVVPTHADATKATTAEYTYTFAGWTPEIVAVTGDAV